MTQIITPRDMGRKAELLDTAQKILALVAAGKVKGICGCVHLRDGGLLRLEDYNGVPIVQLVGGIEIVKAKALSLVLARSNLAAVESPTPPTPIRADTEPPAAQPPAP